MEVRDNPALLHDGSDAAIRLVVTRRLLPYGNNSEWFYPHPALLLGHLLDPSGSTA